MTTYVSIHRIKTIRAEAQGTMGAPVKIEITNDAGSFEAEVCLFTDSVPLSRRIASAINDATKPTEDHGRHLLVAELVDALEAEDCPLDEARDVLRAALDKYENRLEDAYQRQQDSLMEDGGRDDSAFRREITNAGRGHLLR